MPYYRPAEDSEETRVPARAPQGARRLPAAAPHRRAEARRCPALEAFAPLLESSGEREISTTMAFVRILSHPASRTRTSARTSCRSCPTRRAPSAWRACSARSASTPRWASSTRRRTPTSCSTTARTRRARSSRRASTKAARCAAGSRPAPRTRTTACAMVPFYIYYSMFGFQRVGDFAWAAGDMQARGFLIGGTAGRTTLAGEGPAAPGRPQPAGRDDDPELRRLRPGLRLRARGDRAGRPAPHVRGAGERLLLHHLHERELRAAGDAAGRGGRASCKGMYLLQRGGRARCACNLLGSGTILREVLAAADDAREGLRRAGRRLERHELLRAAARGARRRALEPAASRRSRRACPTCGAASADATGPFVAATDYMRIVPDQIRQWVPGRYHVLGTDGYGRSDSRAALRDFFEVDRRYVVVAALKALADEGKLDVATVSARDRALRHRSRQAEPGDGLGGDAHGGASSSKSGCPTSATTRTSRSSRSRCSAGDAVARRRDADHARDREGDDGRAVDRGGRRRGGQGAARRARLAGRPDRRRRGRGDRRRAARRPAAAAPRRRGRSRQAPRPSRAVPRRQRAQPAPAPAGAGRRRRRSPRGAIRSQRGRDSRARTPARRSAASRANSASTSARSRARAPRAASPSRTSRRTSSACSRRRSAAAPAAALPRVPDVDFAAFGPIERKPLSRIQKIAGPRLHASWVNIPHVTQFDEADITEMEAARARLKDEADGARHQAHAARVRHARLRAGAAGIPALLRVARRRGRRARVQEVRPPRVRGRHAERPRRAGGARRRPQGRLRARARPGDAEREGARRQARRPRTCRAACFTISSLGGIGGTAFTPIINAPEVAILGVSRSSQQPVYQDGAFVPRLMLPLSLSYDHRVIDGADGRALHQLPRPGAGRRAGTAAGDP